MNFVSYGFEPVDFEYIGGLFGAIGLPIADAISAGSTTVPRVIATAIGGGLLAGTTVLGRNKLPARLRAYKIILDEIQTISKYSNNVANKHPENANHNLRKRPKFSN